MRSLKTRLFKAVIDLALNTVVAGLTVFTLLILVVGTIPSMIATLLYPYNSIPHWFVTKIGGLYGSTLFIIHNIMELAFELDIHYARTIDNIKRK